MGTVLLAVSVELIPSHDCFLYGIHQTREVLRGFSFMPAENIEKEFSFCFFYRDRSSCRHGLILSHDGFLQGIHQTLAVGNLIVFPMPAVSNTAVSSFFLSSSSGLLLLGFFFFCRYKTCGYNLRACACWFASR